MPPLPDKLTAPPETIEPLPSGAAGEIYGWGVRMMQKYDDLAQRYNALLRQRLKEAEAQ